MATELLKHNTEGLTFSRLRCFLVLALVEVKEQDFTPLFSKLYGHETEIFREGTGENRRGDAGV